MKQTPLQRHSPLKRSATKRSQPRRDWRQAREKVTSERVCRVWRLGDCQGPVEAAHVIARSCDHLMALEEAAREVHYSGDVVRPGATLFVHPDRIVGLCSKHHRAYDRHALDVLSVLARHEQLQAVADAGGIELARKRLAPSAYRKEAA